MKILSAIKKFQGGLSNIVFPNVCLCCGRETIEKDKYLCSFCLTERFEDANLENKQTSSNVILPDGVILQHALWQFDKDGDLQKLLHALKYDRLTSIGQQLGSALAKRVNKHPRAHVLLDRNKALLVPVPLHYLKFKKRGFNQAFTIARGIKNILNLPICDINAVRRNKFTKSQTGFTLEKRIDNMKDAFRVSQPKQLENKMLIIVDDVFTTGSTSFELARTLKEAGASSIMIWTVAQA